MKPNLHSKPFDETTKAKLAIFKDYLIEWLPVFTKARTIYWPNINIYDFFAGPGYDSMGTKGTPLIILDELKNHYEAIEKNKLNVNLYFNEFDDEKKAKLVQNALSDENYLPFSIRIDGLEFRDSFEKEFLKMGLKGNANLIFLDQYGIKHITDDVFKRIIKLKQTDFLFFISSSTVYRFAQHPSVLQYINIPLNEVMNTPYHKIHNLVLEYFKSLVPEQMQYYLSSFSLKKGSNIYGLIFGSGNVLGIEKFINTCWKLDPERGQANYDIDSEDINANQLDIFTNNLRKPKRLELFENEIEHKILTKELNSEKDVYMFMILNGFKATHVKPVIKKLIESQRIEKCSLTLTNHVTRVGYTPKQINIK